MENMDFLPPTAPSLVFARETYTPYNSNCNTALSRFETKAFSKKYWIANLLSKKLALMFLYDVEFRIYHDRIINAILKLRVHVLYLFIVQGIVSNSVNFF